MVVREELRLEALFYDGGACTVNIRRPDGSLAWGSFVSGVRDWPAVFRLLAKAGRLTTLPCSGKLGG